MLGGTQESWSTLKSGTLAAGTTLGSVEPLFPRIEKTLEELRSMTSDNVPPSSAPQAPPAPAAGAVAPAPPAASVPQSPTAPSAAAGRITIDDFMKVELRVAKVLEAEAVPKSRKLLKLKVDTGTDQRTIVAGIAEAYQPEQLVGRTIVVVANLQPAKLMGIESQGMILAGSVDGGLPTLVGFDTPLAPGARVR
jgi:methionyl-tRNA synthetase